MPEVDIAPCDRAFLASHVIPVPSARVPDGPSAGRQRKINWVRAGGSKPHSDSTGARLTTEIVLPTVSEEASSGCTVVNRSIEWRHPEKLNRAQREAAAAPCRQTAELAIHAAGPFLHYDPRLPGVPSSRLRTINTASEGGVP
jgi:hypothetical protein